MRILGIDPGIAIMGYGVVDFDANKVKVIENGVITTSSKTKNTGEIKYFI